MADLSQVIQQGTQAQERIGPTLSSQGESLQKVTSMQSRDMLQQQAMKMKIQENTDIKGEALVTAGLMKNRPVSAAKKALEDAIESGNASDIQNAKDILKGERVKRNDYIMNLTRSPAAIGILNNMSMADEDIQKNLFNEETFNSMTPEQQDEYTARWTSYAMAQEMQRQKAREEAGELEREKVGGKLQAYKDAGQPLPGAAPKVAGTDKNLGISMYNMLEAGGSKFGVTSAQLGTMIGNMPPQQAAAESKALRILVDDVSSGGKVQVGDDFYDVGTTEGLKGYIDAFKTEADAANYFGVDSGYTPILNALIEDVNKQGWIGQTWNALQELFLDKTPLKGLRASGSND
jgi:hypothetical protein